MVSLPPDVHQPIVVGLEPCDPHAADHDVVMELEKLDLQHWNRRARVEYGCPQSKSKVCTFLLQKRWLLLGDDSRFRGVTTKKEWQTISKWFADKRLRGFRAPCNTED